MLQGAILQDYIHLYEAGDPVTDRFQVSVPLTRIASWVPALVQTTTLQNAVESQVSNVYSIKVADQGGTMQPGQVVEVALSYQDPSLSGKRLMIDKISQNGFALIRKAVATDWHEVNQEGKGTIQ